MIIMMILMVLTIIGVMASQTTITELLISGNDKVHKQTFYQADGGTELAQHVVYHNAICSSTSNGFDDDGYTFDGNPAALLDGSILVEDLTFSNNTTPSDVTTVNDTTRTFAYYPNATVNDTPPHTNFLTNVTTQLNPGSGLQMISGYEGLGAGSVGGGTSKLFRIASQHFGQANSQSLVQVRWRLDNFIIASAAASDCDY